MAALPDEPAGLKGPLGAHDAAFDNGRKTKARGLPHRPPNVKDQPGITILKAMNASEDIHRAPNRSNWRLWRGLRRDNMGGLRASARGNRGMSTPYPQEAGRGE